MRAGDALSYYYSCGQVEMHRDSRIKRPLSRHCHLGWMRLAVLRRQLQRRYRTKEESDGSDWALACSGVSAGRILLARSAIIRTVSISQNKHSSRALCRAWLVTLERWAGDGRRGSGVRGVFRPLRMQAPGENVSIPQKSARTLQHAGDVGRRLAGLAAVG